MNDYFISFDMEGTPYIEHKKQAKYVAKIKNGPKTRYFYTNEEYMAYMENKRGKDKNARPPKPPKPPKKAKGSGMRKPPNSLNGKERLILLTLVRVLLEKLTVKLLKLKFLLLGQ